MFGAVTFGAGALGTDPIPPAIGKNRTYQNAVDLVRLLSHTSGNTTVITADEILQIVRNTTAQVTKENWKALSPYYLQTETLNISGSSNFYKAYYSVLNPYVDKLIGCIFLQGTTRRPIKVTTPEDLDRSAKLSSIHSNSVLGTIYDGFIELFVGSDVVTTPNEYQVEIYYFRQGKLDVTTSNYSAKYIDLSDSFIPEVIDRGVFQVEKTK